MKKAFVLPLVLTIIGIVSLALHSFGAQNLSGDDISRIAHSSIWAHSDFIAIDAPAFSAEANAIRSLIPIPLTEGGGEDNLAAQPTQEPPAGTPAAVASSNVPPLDKFIDAVKRGPTGIVTGVYLPQIAALRVIQQPANNPAYVSSIWGTVTQFSLANDRGTIGLLAHNYLAGASFFSLQAGQEIVIVFGDGTLRNYQVSNIRRFQALSPNNPYSDFVDLDHGGAVLSSTAAFNQIYAGGNQVVFQTCIRANGDLSWGRLFVTATPVQ